MVIIPYVLQSYRIPLGLNIWHTAGTEMRIITRTQVRTGDMHKPKEHPLVIGYIINFFIKLKMN